MAQQFRLLGFSSVVIMGGALLVGGCAGGLKAGAGLKLDSKSGLSVKSEFKTSTEGSTTAAAAEQPSATDVEAALDKALLGANRSEENKARDAFRHPKETLAFFGIRADMSVLEVEPGADASYIEILAPVLRDNGKLTVTNHDKNGPEKSPLTKDALALDAKLTGDAVYDKVETIVIEGRTDYKLGEPASQDLVITFRNLHLWKSDRNEARVYKAIFDALKPGGVFGVVQHRACAGSKADRTFRDGYLPQQYVVDTIEKAGFVFEAESSVNSNWKDTRDYARGVWSLPPVLAMGERDREKMMAIGESDRMTLRFRKPLTAETPAHPPASEKTPVTPEPAKSNADTPLPKSAPTAAETKAPASPAPKAAAATPSAPAATATAPAPAAAAPKTTSAAKSADTPKTSPALGTKAPVDAKSARPNASSVDPAK